MRNFSALLLALVFTGCVQNAVTTEPADTSLFASYPVYFATTRNNTGSDNLNARYGKQRAPLNFGINQMAIPANYPRAHSESFVRWNIELKRDPEKELALINSQSLSAEDFYPQLKQQLSQASAQQVLLFIHGFNTPFERASRITAKMAYDLDLSAPALLFSWPSQERPSAYPADEDHLEWSQPAFNRFLSGLLDQLPEQQLILIGHSMGTRALVKGLIQVLHQHPEQAKQIAGVVLAAPDIDADIFRRDLAPKLTAHQLPITLYTSERDLALIASNSLHGYPRAGFAGDELVIVPGVDTVDASLAETELFGHEYFYQGRHTIMDIYQWLLEQKPANQRPHLQGQITTQGRYWLMQPNQP